MIAARGQFLIIAWQCLSSQGCNRELAVTGVAFANFLAVTSLNHQLIVHLFNINHSNWLDWVLQLYVDPLVKILLIWSRCVTNHWHYPTFLTVQFFRLQSAKSNFITFCQAWFGQGFFGRTFFLWPPCRPRIKIANLGSRDELKNLGSLTNLSHIAAAEWNQRTQLSCVADAIAALVNSPGASLCQWSFCPLDGYHNDCVIDFLHLAFANSVFKRMRCRQDHAVSTLETKAIYVNFRRPRHC